MLNLGVYNYEHLKNEQLSSRVLDIEGSRVQALVEALPCVLEQDTLYPA